MVIFSAIIGLAAPFIPDVLGLARGWLDNKQEREMMKLQLEGAEKSHGWRMDETELKATAADMASARKHGSKPTFGIQLLQAAKESDGFISKWMFNIVFGLYTVIDMFSSFVRPSVTYAIVGLYLAMKYALIYSLMVETGSWGTGLLQAGAWTVFDAELLTLIMAFWFGNRTRTKARIGK